MGQRILAEHGRSLYHIVTGQNAHETVRFAASELQKYLYRSTNVCIPYFSDRCPRRGPEILVGVEARDAGVRIDLTSVQEEGFRIQTEGDDLLICGTTPRGVLYGVYHFLESVVNYRCFAPDCETLEPRPVLKIGDMDVTENPAFEYRDAYYRRAFDGAFASKNRLNATLADISRQRGGNLRFFNFHHSFDDLVPVERYFDSHPEYFSQVNGERIRERTQLCLSNPEVLEIATRQVRQWIKENPHCQIFSVAQNDWYHYCTCPRCREVDEHEESPAGSILTFVNQIAQDIEADYPHVLLHTFAYQYSKKAPRYIRPRRNVIVRLCNIECSWGMGIGTLAEARPGDEEAGFLENIRRWGEICDHLYIWDYTVNFANYLQPFPNLYAMAENIRLYRQCGVRGVLQQGNFSYGGGAALDDLKSYLIARLLWNPQDDMQARIREFTEGYYGKGGPAIRAYIRRIHQAVGEKNLRLYDGPDSSLFDGGIPEQALKLFDQALEAEQDPVIQSRIARERLSAEYVHLARLPMDAPDRNARIDAFAQKVRDFGITELMERTDLELSFEFMKRSQYAADRQGRYLLYYIMR